MPDPFSADWLGQSAPWSYWPSSLLGVMPIARQDARERADGTPDDPWNQSAARWWQPPVGANGASIAPIARQDARERAGGTPNDAWDRTTPAWLRSAMPPLGNSGAFFPQANGAGGQDYFASPPSGTFPDTSRDASSGAGRGILAPLDRPIQQPGESSYFARFEPGYQPQDPGAPLTEGRPDDRRGILGRMIEGAQGGAGNGELGISRESIQRYPLLEMLQIPARMADTVPRVFGATIGGLSGIGAGLAEHFGMSPANADRLQRDLNVGGTIASLVAGAPIARQYARERADATGAFGRLPPREPLPTARSGVPPAAAGEIPAAAAAPSELEQLPGQLARQNAPAPAPAGPVATLRGSLLPPETPNTPVVAPTAETPPFRPASLSAASRDLPELHEGVVLMEHGPHGPILQGYQGRWNEAVDWLQRAETGDALGVLRHPNVPGRIDVIWGEPGPQGYGLAKIAEKHPEVLPDLPERLDRMRLVEERGHKMVLASPDGTERAVISTDFQGARKTWLLTAYEEKGRPGGGVIEGAPGSHGPDRGSPGQSAGPGRAGPPEI